MVSLDDIELGDIRRHRETLLRALWRIYERFAPKWHPDEVLKAVIERRAEFLVRGQDCAVYYVRPDEHTGEPLLWVWAASAETPAEEYMPCWLALAGHFGCKAVGWDSPRLGYLKRMKALGAELESIKYRVAVNG